MTPFKIIRKLLKALRGGSSRREVFLGVLLGFGVGLVPGFNLTLLLFLLPLLFLNVNGAAGGLALLLGKVLMIAAAAGLYYLGYFLIHVLGLSALVRVLADTPVAALLDWHIYSVLAAFVLSLIIGSLLGAWISAALYKAHKVMSEAGAADSASKAGKFGRFLLRFMAGKKIDEDALKSPLVRKGRCAIALVIVVVGAVFSWLCLDGIAARAVVGAIGKLNGAEVNIEEMDISLGGGSVSIHGLQVTDADDPEDNRVQAELITVDLSVADLLCRRLSVAEIVCSDVAMGAERKSPGEVYRDSDSKSGQEGEKESESLLDSVTGTFSDTANSVVKYVKQVKEVNTRLAQLRDWLKERAEKMRQHRQADPEQFRRDELKARGFLRAQASELLAKHPAWLIRHVKAEGVVLAPALPGFTIEGRNISSDSDLVEEDMSLIARPDDKALEGLKNAAGAVVEQTDKAVRAIGDTAGDIVGGAADEAGKAAKEIGGKLKGIFNKD